MLAFEPNTAFHDDLRTAATDTDLELEIHTTDVRDIELPPKSIECVVSTITLCSVGDQQSMVSEIHRILAPGGRLVFIEHVTAEGRTAQRWQRLVGPIWSAVGDGCSTTPDTVEAIRAAGFTSIEAELTVQGPAIDPTAPTFWGVATK